MKSSQVILLTGVTGYIGGRLLAALAPLELHLRCLVRNPSALPEGVAAGAEVVRGDALDPISLAPALAGVEAAYYLIHAMDAPGAFEDKDRRAAGNFAAAARAAGVGRIIYLGGLGRGEKLSRHLSSRQEVGEILRDSGIPTLEFRASIIIGPGSISFELIRALVDRLPVMVTPRWVSTLTQPIAVDDVIAYLVAGFDLPLKESAIFEIGGPERCSYLDLMREYARQQGLRRLILPVPVLTPWLSSLWLGLVTPLQARVGRRLLEGVRNETLITDEAAARVFPLRPRGYREAIRQALAA